VEIIMATDPNADYNVEFLDAEQVVADYRDAVEQRDAACTPERFVECDTLVHSLRRRWAEYNGGDESELHEMAYGGPWQD
jgi:hypothetical protein